MKNPSSFEEAGSRLEAVIARMESGEEDLDKTVASFEEGRRLLSFCQEKLAAAERKVEILVRGADGKAAAVPFEENLPGLVDDK